MPLTASAYDCLGFLGLLILPLFLARLKWSSRAIGLTTGAVASLLAELWGIQQNGIDFGLLQIGLFNYLLGFVLMVPIFGLPVWLLFSLLRRQSLCQATSSAG